MCTGFVQHTSHCIPMANLGAHQHAEPGCWLLASQGEGKAKYLIGSGTRFLEAREKARSSKVKYSRTHRIASPWSPRSPPTLWRNLGAGCWLLARQGEGKVKDLIGCGTKLQAAKLK